MSLRDSIVDRTSELRRVLDTLDRLAGTAVPPMLLARAAVALDKACVRVGDAVGRLEAVQGDQEVFG